MIFADHPRVQCVVWRTDPAHAGRDCWGQVVSGLLLLTPPVLTDTI